MQIYHVYIYTYEDKTIIALDQWAGGNKSYQRRPHRYWKDFAREVGDRGQRLWPEEPWPAGRRQDDLKMQGRKACHRGLKFCEGELKLLCRARNAMQRPQCHNA